MFNSGSRTLFAVRVRSCAFVFVRFCDPRQCSVREQSLFVRVRSILPWGELHYDREVSSKTPGVVRSDLVSHTGRQ